MIILGHMKQWIIEKSVQGHYDDHLASEVTGGNLEATD